MNSGDYIDLGTLAIAAVAVGLSYYTAREANQRARTAEERAKQAEDIAALLGEKETVAFAALKLQKNGLPSEPDDLSLMLGAIMTACVFSSSDRARALLYNVIATYRTKYQTEIQAALDDVERTFVATRAYNFPSPPDPKDKFDLATGFYRIDLLKIVFAGTP